jgi:hypothetical protein
MIETALVRSCLGQILQPILPNHAEKTRVTAVSKIRRHDAPLKVARTKYFESAAMWHPANHLLEFFHCEHVVQLFGKCHFFNVGSQVVIGLRRHARKVPIATVNAVVFIEGILKGVRRNQHGEGYLFLVETGDERKKK